MFLNITQRQMCEKIFTFFDRSSLTTDMWTNFLAVVMSAKEETEGVSGNITDLVNMGIVNENLTLNELAIFDDAIEKDISGVSECIRFKFNETVPSRRATRTFSHTIMDYVRLKGASTIVECFGSPVMNLPVQEGVSTMMEYLRRVWPDAPQYQIIGSLNVTYKNRNIHVCDLMLDGETGKYLIMYTANDDDDDYLFELFSCVGMCGQINAMLANVASALSNNVCTPSDLLAVLSKYQNSKWSTVASFARDMARSGSNAIQSAIANFVAMFRSANDFTENVDGSITWNAKGTSISTSAWAVAKQVFASVAQVIGNALLMAGNIALKIIGGAIMIAGSIGQAINNTVGQITGTAPFINDDAIDDVYGDVIFQGTETIPWHYFRTATETTSNLIDNRRTKIITPWCIIYLYNAVISEDDDSITCDYKIFTRMGPINYNTFDSYARVHSKNLRGFMNGYLECIRFYANPKLSEFLYDICKYNESHDTPSFDYGSANANDWPNLWKSMVSSLMVTLIMVFSNPIYQDNGAWVRVGWGSNKYDDLIQPLTHSIVDNLMDSQGEALVNLVGAFAGINHDSENVLLTSLYSIGILEITDDEIDSYVGSHTVLLAGSEEGGDPSGGVSCPTVDALTSSGTQDASNYWDDYYLSLQFLAIDRTSFVVPPAHSYRSVLFAAVIAAAAVALVVTATVVTRALVKRAFKPYWTRKTQQLNADMQVFRNGFTSEEWEQLSPEDKAEWNRAFRKASLRVNFHNKISSLLGMSSVDWMNNWYDHQSTSGYIPLAPTSAGSLSIAELSGIDSTNDVVMNDGLSTRQSVNDGFETESISLASIQRLITG